MTIDQDVINDLKNKVLVLEKIIDIGSLNQKLAEIDNEFASDLNIWENSRKVNNLNKEKTILQKKILEISDLNKLLQDIQAAHDLDDNEDLLLCYNQAHKLYESLEGQTFMNGKFDDHDAIVSLHSGAGGVDAQDFAGMLMSMYQAFCKNYDYELKQIHISTGEEAGIKSATFRISGPNAYGHLKEEAGVHRLIRLSPFNSGKTRETSFAAVEVLPADLHEKFGMENIPEDDLKWDYFMSSGKGGQSVNTTYSAVRVTHVPTGISVSCQNERNQLQNKQQALKYLHDKLAVLELKKQKDMEIELKGIQHGIEWGSQIRTYTLHPYKLVKDHRSGFESSDPENILENGDILPIIWSVKKSVT
jgi:peptide chain release factor 2